MKKHPQSVVMMGATGAVGTQALAHLLTMPEVNKITLLGRSPVVGIDGDHVSQHKIDIFSQDTYRNLISGHTTAICTLGVGEPSKTSKEDFIKIDKTAVLDFAKACKAGGVKHFELLASVGISADSSSYYLRTKGELVEELKALDFERLSIFEPSMILTPTNRYGMLQGILLVVWPWLHPLLMGGLKKYRGVKVEQLGQAMARNIMKETTGYEVLRWEDFQ
jgi:uncharacterized protein YbjT (DUF2867 family)